MKICFHAPLFILAVWCTACATVPVAEKRAVDSLARATGAVITERPLCSFDASSLGGDSGMREMIGTLNIKGTQTMNGLSVNVLTANDDSSSITIGGPFGVTVGSLFVAHEYFQFLNYFTQEVYKGNPTSAQLRQKLPFPLDVPTMMALMAGTFPKGEPFACVKHLEQPHHVLFQRKSVDRTEFIAVDTLKRVIVQYQQKLPSGATVVNATLGDFQQHNTVWIPTAVDVAVEDKSQQAQFRFTTVRIQQPLSSTMRASIPSGFTPTIFK
jgi:hypothetical protein